mgnify:FL=1
MRRRNSTPPPQGESAGGLEGKTDAAEEKEITFTEQVVADNEECKITITGFGREESGTFYLSTLLENKSSDKTYEFSLDSAAVNGVSIPYFSDPTTVPSVDLAPGKEANEKLHFLFLDWGLNYNDIGDYTDIELVFQVRENDRWGADVLEAKTVHIYPYGEDKAVEFVREAQPSDKVILDNEYATVIFVGEGNEKFKEKKDSKHYNFEMFVINKTDKMLRIGCILDSFSVNGFKAEPASSFWKTEVNGGKCGFSTMWFSKEDLEKYGIKDYEDFEEIKFKFKINDFNINDYGFRGIVNNLGEYEITLNP